MIKSWSDDAWEDFLYWQEQDKKTLKRTINTRELASLKDYRGICPNIGVDALIKKIE